MVDTVEVVVDRHDPLEEAFRQCSIVGKTVTPTILVTYCDVLTKAYSSSNQFGITELMAPLPSRLDVLAWQLGTHSGSKAYWDPDPAYDHVEY